MFLFLCAHFRVLAAPHEFDLVDNIFIKIVLQMYIINGFSASFFQEIIKDCAKTFNIILFLFLRFF